MTGTKGQEQPALFYLVLRANDDPCHSTGNMLTTPREMKPAGMIAMTYNSYLAELAFFNVNTIHLGLGPISRLLARLGNPQDTYPSLLIGGTNGKGSISALAASIIEEGGYRVGLYTSPHLLDVRERIRINGEMISPEDLSALVADVKGSLMEDVTYFEFLTALAFLYFQRERVDIAVLEVGLGGRLDATNVVQPLLSVISNVALDHMEYLGNTVREIAREKGGIIKERGICLTAAKDREALAVLAEICLQKGATLKRLGKEIRLVRHRSGAFSYSAGCRTYTRLECSLLGKHQQENAAMAIGVVEELRNRGFTLAEEAIRRGLANTRWEGRLEAVHEAPLIILDGAHNPAGVKILCAAMERDFAFRRLVIVFGVLSDKDFRSMIRPLAKRADRFILTKPDSSRAVSPFQLLPLAAPYCREVAIEADPSEAIKTALAWSLPEDLIVIAGSLYLVGQAKKILPSLTH